MSIVHDTKDINRISSVIITKIKEREEEIVKRKDRNEPLEKESKDGSRGAGSKDRYGGG